MSVNQIYIIYNKFLFVKYKIELKKKKKKKWDLKFKLD